MQRTERLDNHESFKELCALAQAGSLSNAERLNLERHLQVCESCREIYDTYSAISKEGMPFLAANYDLPEEAQKWDNSEAWQRLLSSIRDQRSPKVLSFKASSPRVNRNLLHTVANRGWVVAAVAACLVTVIALGAYRLGERAHIVPQQMSAVQPLGPHTLIPPKQASVDLLVSQAAQISKLESEISSGQQELTRLRAASNLAEERVNELGSANHEKEAELRRLTDERDKLAAQLSESEKSYQSLQTDLTNLRAEHSQSLLHTASLESKLADVTSTTHDQDRRLKDAEQYLVSDRDIRELMGARKLYIADVFDVDSGSRTRKPFGRVFYTQSKSLVFYAFDLDHQPGVKTANAFQVWGQRDSESNAESHPTNLGILYMDSESNRRWVLRFDDPKQLAEIDAVFVTVEPHGGSQKPTGKPFLYALLRKEVNHP